MKILPIDRRTFLRNTALLALSAPLLPRKGLAEGRDGTSPAAAAQPPVTLGWLDKTPPASFAGTTWGVPWSQGAVAKESAFHLLDKQGVSLSLQSWPLALWPDGSIKWSAHALGGRQPQPLEYRLAPTAASPAGTNMVTETEQEVIVDTGDIRCIFPRRGPLLLKDVSRDGHSALQNGRLVLQIRTDADSDAPVTVADFQGEVENLAVEQNGPVRAVITLRGSHRRTAGESGARLPFIVRVYLYAGSAALRLMHTIIYDGDERQEFITGLGLRFDVPQDGPLHDRHVRFAGDTGGVFGEAVRGLTGLRRDPGAAVTQAQLAGRATPPLDRFAPIIADNLQYIPAFGSYRLSQHHPDGFQIHKRTAGGAGWLLAATGQRAAGAGYLGSPTGGVVFGIRNFWQSYPARLDITDAHTPVAGITLWLWSPGAEPMDMRFYHDGMDETDYARQRVALDVTYEDYEPGFASPQGVARTSEIHLDILPATPDNRQLVAIARRIQNPPLLVTSPEQRHATGVFGPVWAPVDASNARQQPLEAQLAWYFDFYRHEVEQRKWYGFWDYGDVMHTYDGDRHVWRYDVGGYAWDNSELSTDLWLWYYYLRTGRQDVFRMAEAMTRHTGEVDVYHAGRFSPLGSRHNVRHWGDSAKQLRISTVANRRFLYYLTADERIGDLMREQVFALKTLREIEPGRKIGQNTPENSRYISLYFGTDWGAVAAAWMTEWERTGDRGMRDRLLRSMESIASQPYGFFTGVAEMDPDSGVFMPAAKETAFISHLSAAFGLAETCSELLTLLPSESFSRAWLDYCRLYNDPRALAKYLGKPVKPLNLAQGHSRLTAFAAWRLQDPRLARLAWQRFFSGSGGIEHPSRQLNIITPPAYLYPLKEARVDSTIDKHSGSISTANLSTNAVAQWGIAAISLLALVGNQLPRNP